MIPKLLSLFRRLGDEEPYLRWVETELGLVMVPPHITDEQAVALYEAVAARKREEVRQAAIARRKGKYRMPR